MEAQTFTVKTPRITGGRSHMPLVRTDVLMSGLNYYAPGRKNKLHTHPGEDHMFVVLDGEATFFDKDEKQTVLGKGEGILLPEGHYYQFASTGRRPWHYFDLPLTSTIGRMFGVSMSPVAPTARTRWTTCASMVTPSKVKTGHWVDLSVDSFDKQNLKLANLWVAANIPEILQHLQWSCAVCSR